MTVFLPCITTLVSFSPENDNYTTSEVKLSRAWRKPIYRFNCRYQEEALTKVAKCGSAAPGRCVAVVDASHHQQLLGHGGGHDTGTTGGGDETHQHRAAASSHLAGHGVGLTDLVTPVTSPDGDDGQLGQDDGSSDGSGYLFGALHPQAHVTVVVTDGNKGLKWEQEGCNITPLHSYFGGLYVGFLSLESHRLIGQL